MLKTQVCEWWHSTFWIGYFGGRWELLRHNTGYVSQLLRHSNKKLEMTKVITFEGLSK